MKNLFYTMMGVALVGCGGGDGDSPQGGGGPSPTPTVTVTQTEDLVAPEGFSYNATQAKVLQVDVSSQASGRAHLSVYSAYTQNSAGDRVPDYNSRLVSLPLSNGQAEVELTVANVTNDYLAEIWFYDGSPPMQMILSSDDSEWRW
uniref:hypothetical protein n=1 Tax=Thaumasiovibrio occultus TaxID=1891184 RepID=UPI000B34C95E|nr:hypothetical protein [Thaumasiovibrio occultus]